MTAPTTDLTPPEHFATRGRKPLQASSEPPIEINETRLAEMTSASLQHSANVTGLAEQLGYDGSLTVGALEDEIRFYQRRSVEAILALGTRLLLLKEMTPHGEFVERIKLLGFADRTARRFMQAAYKTAKSATVAVLANQVSNSGKFLELVTLDDDDLQALVAGDSMAGIRLDDIDRMSVSELRAAMRKAREDQAVKGGKGQLLVERQAKQIDDLADELTRLKRNRPAIPAPEFLEAEALAELMVDARQTAAHLRTSLVALCGNVYALFPEHQASETARRGVGAALGLILAALRDTAADFDVLPEEATVVDGLAHEDQALWDVVNAQIAATEAATEEASNEPAQD